MSRPIPDQAVEPGEPVVREAVAVPDHLVENVRLGRVQRHRVVPDVLSRMESPVREGAIEVL